MATITLTMCVHPLRSLATTFAVVLDNVRERAVWGGRSVRGRGGVQVWGVGVVAGRSE